jgi:hypothetical protein
MLKVCIATMLLARYVTGTCRDMSPDSVTTGPRYSLGGEAPVQARTMGYKVRVYQRLVCWKGCKGGLQWICTATRFIARWAGKC